MAGRAKRKRPRRARAPVAVLAISGSDPSGGAGLQADVKTLESFGVVATGVVTTVTVQTTTRVRDARPVAPALVKAQIDAACATIAPRVVKCGLLGSPANVRVVAAYFSSPRTVLVLDPVTTASAPGRRLGAGGLFDAIVAHLFPLGPIVTVNLVEAGRITGMAVDDEEGMRASARRIAALGPRAVVVKGGHLAGDVVDVLYANRRFHRFPAPRVAGGMHGTGCAFASALAAGLAMGRALPAAVGAAGAHVRLLLHGAVSTLDGGRLRAPAVQKAKVR